MNLSNEYVAGFFDADGSIGVYARRGRGGQNYQVNVAIANSGKHGEIICQHLKDKYGGTVTFRKSKKEDTQRPIFWWRLTGGNVIEKFILDILEFSIIKKDQLGLSLQYIRKWRTFPRYKTDEQKEYAYEVTETLKKMKKAC